MSVATVKDLAGAQGKEVLFIASLLQRADIMPMAEFSRLLATFAVTIGETDPGAGQIWRPGLVKSANSRASRRPPAVHRP